MALTSCPVHRGFLWHLAQASRCLGWDCPAQWHWGGTMVPKCPFSLGCSPSTAWLTALHRHIFSFSVGIFPVKCKVNLIFLFLTGDAHRGITMGIWRHPVTPWYLPVHAKVRRFQCLKAPAVSRLFVSLHVFTFPLWNPCLYGIPLCVSPPLVSVGF